MFRIPKFRLLLVLLLAAGVVLGWMGVLRVPLKDAWTIFSREVDTSIVDSYDARYTLADNGDLTVDERIAVEFTEQGKHGIFRIFDTADSQFDIDHPVEVQTVERRVDGQWQPEPWVESQSGGDTTTIRIGDADVTHPMGIQRYRIVSTTTGAITYNETGSQWYWDVVGSGWMMPMREVSVRAQLPATTAAPTCEASVSCAVVPEAGAWTISVDDLDPYTPITMKALFATPVAKPAPDWGQYWLLVPAVLFAALTVVLTLATFTRSRERRPNPALRFDPPGPDPLICAWLLDEEPAGRAVPAVLLNLVAHDVVTFSAEPRTAHDDEGPDWISLRRTQNPVPPLTGFAEALQALDLTSAGSTRTITKKSVADGKVLKELDAELTRAVEPAVESAGLARPVTGSCLALTMIYLAIIGGFSALIWVDQGLLVATVLVLAAIAGLLITRRDQTQLSRTGSDVRDATLGFKQVLSTKASLERFDYAARVRHFDEYLPWAVAFDCAEEWAASCTPPPGSEQMSGVGTYYSSPTRTSQMWAFSSGITAVEASAVAAYQATQSSSSGGGGGGGGGSGGGGGGSW